jgi:hypothetical protein
MTVSKHLIVTSAPDPFNLESYALLNPNDPANDHTSSPKRQFVPLVDRSNVTYIKVVNANDAAFPQEQYIPKIPDIAAAEELPTTANDNPESKFMPALAPAPRIRAALRRNYHGKYDLLTQLSAQQALRRTNKLMPPTSHSRGRSNLRMMMLPPDALLHPHPDPRRAYVHITNTAFTPMGAHHTSAWRPAQTMQRPSRGFAAPGPR